MVQSSFLTQIINQWGKSVKGRMTLTAYLQIYGVLDMVIYSFSGIPEEYVGSVVEQ